MMDRYAAVEFLLLNGSNKDQSSGRKAMFGFKAVTPKGMAQDMLKKTQAQGNFDTTLQSIIDLLDRFEPAKKNAGTEVIATPRDTIGLASVLQQYGIDSTLYGTKGTKGLGSLLKELGGGECQLAVSSDALLRVVEPVFIALRFTHNGVTKYCVEEHQTYA